MHNANPNKPVSVSEICSVIDLLYYSMDDYLFVYDFKDDYYYISPHAVQKFPLPGNSFHDVVKNHEKFVYGPDLEELQEDLNQILSGKKSEHNLQYHWVDLEGNPVWINCRGQVVSYNNEALYMIGCINEIGKEPTADNVSGLLGLNSLKKFIKDFSSLLPNGFILRLGLDDFKEINEKLGIEYGDSVLKITADCISECLAVGQKVYRIVADQFIILDYLGGKRSDALHLYKKIRRRIDQFVADSCYEAVFTISGGLIDTSTLNNQELNYSNIMRLSEFSLNEAKRSGKNQCYVFSQKDYDSFLKRKELAKVLRQSAFNNFEGYELYFQPLYEPDSNKLYGAEALLRFHSPEYGTLSPSEFIPILEDTKLIIPVGKWIVRQALKTCKIIQESRPDFKISINLSYVQLMKSDIVDDILNGISDSALCHSSVIIELTESGLLESNPRFTKLWDKLKNKGVLIALDDFGTGYSNFHYMYDLKPDIIKIDRSFTVKALQNDYEYRLLQLMRGMVHDLDFKICIEGIESTDEKNMVLTLNPDYCQGYYFGRPCSHLEFMNKFV